MCSLLEEEGVDEEDYHINMACYDSIDLLRRARSRAVGWQAKCSLGLPLEYGRAAAEKEKERLDFMIPL